jgi:hypothetical protein
MFRFASVWGNMSSDDAKIGGMTPAMFTRSGRCDVCRRRHPCGARRMRSRVLMGIRRWPRSKKTMNAVTANAIAEDHEEVDGLDLPDSSPAAGLGEGVGQVGHDAREDDERDAVADAALGDLLAEPHDERGARGQRDASS